MFNIIGDEIVVFYWVRSGGAENIVNYIYACIDTILLSI